MATFTPDEIARGFVAQADKQGAKKATKHLAALILQERLHGQVDQILENIRSEYQNRHGQVEATATSVYPLSKELRQMLSTKIKQQTNAKTVILHEEIDHSLLGGVKVTAPDMELDLSLKTRLNNLRV